MLLRGKTLKDQDENVKDIRVISTSDFANMLASQFADSGQGRLSAVLFFLMRAKVHLVSGAAIGFVLSVLYLQVSTQEYRAWYVIAPTSQSLESMPSSLDGFAGLAGLNFSAGMPVAPYDLYIEYLTTRAVAKELETNSEVMKRVFQKEWDEEQEDWDRPSDPVSVLKRTIHWLTGREGWIKPNPGRLQIYIKERIGVKDAKQSELITIEYYHSDPDFARLFLERLHAISDQAVRTHAETRAQDYVDYVTNELLTATSTDQRGVLINILSDQLNTLMLASASQNYAADVIDGINASDRPVRPIVVIVILAFLVFGSSIGVMVFLIGQLKAQRKARPALQESRQATRS